MLKVTCNYTLCESVFVVSDGFIRKAGQKTMILILPKIQSFKVYFSPDME